MRRRKLFNLILGGALATSMLLSITGCGSGTNEKENINTNANTSGEQITLKFWDMVWGDTEYAAEAEKLAQSYTEVNPNVKIEYQSIPWQNRYETFSVAIASGEGPDVSTGGGYQQHQFAASDDILPLDSIVDEWKEEGTDKDFPEGMLEFFQDEEGNQLGIPFNIDPRGIIYRKDLFEEKGIAVPTTWDELYDAIVALSDVDNGKYGLVYPVADSSANIVFMTWLLSNGGGVWNEDGKTPTWNSQENLETLDFIKKLKDANVFPEGMASYENPDAQKLFLQGDAAMIINSVGFGTQITEAGEELSSNCALMSIPKGPSVKESSIASAMNAYMVYKSTKYPEEAKAFIKWWSENNLGLWTGAAKCGSPPARLSFLNDSSYKNMKQNPFISEMIEEWLPEMRSTMYPASSANLVQNTIDAEKWWRDVSQAVLVGEKENQDILDSEQKKAEEVIQDIGY